MLIKIVKDELTHLMGSEASEINLKDKPSIILMSGLQGSGKTTFSAKLSNYLSKKKNLKPWWDYRNYERWWLGRNRYPIIINV